MHRRLTCTGQKLGRRVGARHEVAGVCAGGERGSVCGQEAKLA